jgi:NAD(P)-dependent dehydrogenase (short-subunit alcohol dehydrogenase family)
MGDLDLTPRFEQVKPRSMTKLALITGASRGLGAALAEALAPTHHIVAVARTTGALEELDDRIQARGGSATLAPMDITVEDAMATLCRGIYDRWGSLDMWLHTAIHAAPLSPANFVDTKDWAKSMAINATATAVLIPFVAPLLGDAGHAVFFDDPRGGDKFFGAYGASKAAQMALARSWQAETVRTGPKVHIVSPRPMPTATRARFFPGEDRAPLAAPMDEAKRLLADLLT